MQTIFSQINQRESQLHLNIIFSEALLLIKKKKKTVSENNEEKGKILPPKSMRH